jgi:hypothetical protein
VNNCPGRVAASNQQLISDTHELSLIYQSIVIFFTFIFGALFWFMSYRLFSLSSSTIQFWHILIPSLNLILGISEAKKFVFRTGAIIVTSFMLRCILFIILLAADFISDIYLFITLMITEVIMMFLVQLEFNKNTYATVVSTVTGTSLSGSHSHHQSSFSHESGKKTANESTSL